MDKFPSILHSDNKDKLYAFKIIRITNLLRSEIYDFLLFRNNENQYFELDRFANKYINNNMNLMNQISSEIIHELKDLNWNCKSSFGNTGLFIYSTDSPPPSCFPDDF